MKVLLKLIFLTLLCGCASKIQQSSLGGDYFDVVLHFTSSSELEANATAINKCGGIELRPVLVTHKKGCVFVCGGEYDRYTYKCTSNRSVTEANAIKRQSELEEQLRIEKLKQAQQNIESKKMEQEESERIQTNQFRTDSKNKLFSKNAKRIALVIGNANYGVASLKNPINDASDISEALKKSGFEVIDQRNATLQEMTKGIRDFGDRLLKSDVGLVYFSGHGIEVKGRNYLLPVGASMLREDEIAFQAIDANLILEKMNTAKKSVNILIVDACRDNPFARSFRSTNRGLAQMDAPTGTIVSFSTSPGKTASDGEGRNSPYTKSLIQSISQADVPIEAMFKEVRKSVVEETKGQQTPWESSSLIGDFYFKVSK